MNTNYWDEQQLKKTDVFFSLLKMHTTYTYTQKEKKSLKNTKINYTKDLLRHCLLIFWEDFFSMCAASLSPSKVIRSLQISSFCHSSNMLATSPHLGVKSAQ